MFVRPCWKARTTGEMLGLIDGHPCALLVNCQLTPIFFLVATVWIVISGFVASFWQALLGVALILVGLPLYAVFSLQERRAR